MMHKVQNVLFYSLFRVMYTDGELKFDNAVMLNENPVNISIRL